MASPFLLWLAASPLNWNPVTVDVISWCPFFLKFDWPVPLQPRQWQFLSMFLIGRMRTTWLSISLANTFVIWLDPMRSDAFGFSAMPKALLLAVCFYSAAGALEKDVECQSCRLLRFYCWTKLMMTILDCYWTYTLPCFCNFPSKWEVFLPFHYIPIKHSESYESKCIMRSHPMWSFCRVGLQVTQKLGIDSSWLAANGLDLGCKLRMLEICFGNGWALESLWNMVDCVTNHFERLKPAPTY